MKTNLWALALVLGIGGFFPALSLAGPNGSLSLDGQLSRRITGTIGHDYGMGGSLFLEFQPIQAFSIGVGADLLDFVGVNTPGQSFLESLNVVGRGILNAGEPWQPYLTGGYGINPKVDLQGNYTWWGNYHVMGGLGTFYFFDPHCAVDMAVVYNYFESGADPVNTVSVRLGFSYFFAPALNKYSITGRFAPAPKLQAEGRVVGVPISKKEMGAPASRPQAGAMQPVVSGFDQAHRSNQRASNPPKRVESVNGEQVRPGSLSQTKRVESAKKEMGTATKIPFGQVTFRMTVSPTTVPVSKTKPASAAVPQGSAIGPKGLASFRGEPAPPVQTPAPKVKAGAPVPTAKAPASKPQARGEQVRPGSLSPAKHAESAKKEMGAAAPVTKAAVQAPAPKAPAQKVKSSSPTAVKKAATATPVIKTKTKSATGQVAFREPAAKAATPTSKKEMGTPASKPQAVSSFKPANGTKRVESVSGEQVRPGSLSQTKRVESAKKRKSTATATPVTKKPAQAPVSKTPSGQVSFREPTPAASPSLKPETSAEGPAEILTLKNQSLWDTAARKDVYGDPELYPLLLDANRKVLKPDLMALKAGTRLAVPRGVSEEMIQKARLNAWTNDYMRYRGMGMSKPDYEKSRKSISK